MLSEKCWYKKCFLSYLLYPFSILYLLIVIIRRLLYKKGICHITSFKVPVVVIGNIAVGGTGKTPLVIWLANHLKEQGKKPGIVSRGYGGHADHYPYVVQPDSSPDIVGDEPLLIAKRTGCPVVVAPNRVKAAQKLLEISVCDIIISDDGLQHYALARDLEIVVVDAQRKFGNGFCLPAGPLREPIARLKTIDFVIINGGNSEEHEYSMQLIADKLYNLANNNITRELTELKGKQVHAVAGIGNPQRFFDLLRSYDIKVIEHPFPDHYYFKEQDLLFGDNLDIIMTEKDAVKCQNFTTKNLWQLPVTAKPCQSFIKNSMVRLQVIDQ